MEPFIAVFDVGTSSLKGVVYSDSGEVLTSESFQYSISTPSESRAEMDPGNWLLAFEEVTEALRKNGIDLSVIKGIALTGQMHSAVLLDKNEEVVSPSILWLDRRAVGETKELQEHFQLMPYRLNSSYTLPKLYWLSKNQPEVLRKTDLILWPKDYLRFHLTGVKCTDFTEGIGSALIDWDTKQWLPERIEICGKTVDILPDIKPQETLLPIKSDIAVRFGFSPNCQVLVGLGDIAALLGGAPHAKGRIVYSMGSSSMYFTEVDFNPGEDRGLYPLELAGYSLFGGVSSTTGAALTWAHEQFWGGKEQISFEEMIQKALEGEMEKDPVLFFPFLAGERSPFWSDAICGGFEGLKLHHTKANLTRAVMEGVACSVRYVLDIMHSTGVEINEIALAGGGARTEGWPEMISSVTDKPVTIYNTRETVTTVLYAMLAAELQNAPFREILQSLFTSSRKIEPDPGRVEKYTPVYDKYVRFLDAKLGIYNVEKENN